MTKALRSVAAIVAGATLLALQGGALAQTGTAKTPTQSDFDFCNSEANISAGSTTGGSASPPSTMTPGVGAGAATGSTLGTGNSMSSSSMGSASVSSDPQLRGIASSGTVNPAYQQAYRDCLKRRGF